MLYDLWIPLLFCACHFTNLDSTRARIHDSNWFKRIDMFVSDLKLGCVFCIMLFTPLFVLLWNVQKQYVLNRALPNMKHTNEHGIIAMYSELFTQLNESDLDARSHKLTVIRWMSCSVKQTNKTIHSFAQHIPQLQQLKKWRITHFVFVTLVWKKWFEIYELMQKSAIVRSSESWTIRCCILLWYTTKYRNK